MTSQEPRTSQSADQDALDTEIIAVSAPAPVFVDTTGRRSRLLRGVALAFGVLVVAYGGLLSVSLAGGPVSSGAGLPLPGLDDERVATGAATPQPRPSPTPQPSTAAGPRYTVESLQRRTGDTPRRSAGPSSSRPSATPSASATSKPAGTRTPAPATTRTTESTSKVQPSKSSPAPVVKSSSPPAPGPVAPAPPGTGDGTTP
ncbi:hypothetical protein AB0F72_26905 [Actinoplanes sp. NPDC023936]|uniref:hypothetical protein n=1 Tax=Actinoplanes sp. NPDC023936 TaxID=3154910 RepID=UPI003404A9B9